MHWATVHERVLWNPIPIPDQPLEFYVNLGSIGGNFTEGSQPDSRMAAASQTSAIDTHHATGLFDAGL